MRILWFLLTFCLVGCATTTEGIKRDPDNAAERKRLMLEQNQRKSHLNNNQPYMVIPLVWYTW